MAEDETEEQALERQFVSSKYKHNLLPYIRQITHYEEDSKEQQDYIDVLETGFKILQKQSQSYVKTKRYVRWAPAKVKNS